MKKTVLVIAFLVFFINYQGFAFPSKDKSISEKIEKLDGEIKDIRGEINTIKGELNTIKEEINTIKGEIIEIKTDIKNINDNIAKIVNQENKLPEKNPEKPTPNNNSVTSSRNVIGQGTLKPQNVIVYARRKNPALKQTDEQIILKYFDEASIEGVNVDLAIAQMLYWTDNMKQRVSTNNFGGLNRIDNFNGTFKDVTTGVRAHIQHLKGYGKETPKQEKVDPRFDEAYKRGSQGIKFDQVYGMWSPKPEYGDKIDNILRDLYRS